MSLSARLLLALVAWYMLSLTVAIEEEEAHVPLLAKPENDTKRHQPPAALMAKAKAIIDRLESEGRIAVRARGQTLQKFLLEDEARHWNNLVDGTCELDWSASVANQLSTWQGKKFTVEDLNLYCKHRQTVRVQVIKGRMRFARWNQKIMSMTRIRSSLWLLKLAYERAAARGTPLPDIELALSSGDGAQGQTSVELQWPDPAPLFCNTKCSDASISFPMTLHDQFGIDKTGEMCLSLYNHRFETLLRMGNASSWHLKQNKMFFSGQPKAINRGQRDRLFELKDDAAEIINHDVKLDQYGRYRFLIYAYGNCFWSRRMHELAVMNATVLVESAQCHEYFFDLFKEGEQYISVAEDFSDVKEKLHAAMHNLHKSEAMAASWLQTGSKIFTLSCTLDYVDRLLREYARLQDFIPFENIRWKEFTFEMDPDSAYHAMMDDATCHTKNRPLGFKPINSNLTSC